MKERIYVCHTFYHVYISILKELKIKADQGEAFDYGATIVLSTMSNNFGEIGKRIESVNLFEEVIYFDEKRDDYFPELAVYKKDTGFIVTNMINRHRFYKKFTKLERPYIPVDFREYGEIYVFCDSDPIGYYLNANHIPYHAVEDGLNCLKNYDTARYDNRGHFKLKAFMSKKLNYIFIQNGYGKYCKDMEVNDIDAIQYSCPYYVEEKRRALYDRLTIMDKDILLTVFVKDKEILIRQINDAGKKKDKILILTDPLCTLEIREQIFKDIVKMYEPEGEIFFKPHPRDELDYKTIFKDYPQFDATVPMEILNFFPGLKFTKVVGVLTEMKDLDFAQEMVRLGPDFMDKYEEASVHRQNENIY